MIIKIVDIIKTSEKQKVLKLLKKAIKNNFDIVLIGENHTVCPHSGLETMAIRKLNKETGYEPKF